MASALVLAPAGAEVALATGVANDDEYGSFGRLVLEDQAFRVLAPGVFENDSAAGGEALCLVNPPTTSSEGGTVSLGADGSFVYTPAANFTGLDSFVYAVADAAGGPCPASEDDTAIVNLTVTPLNDRPTMDIRGACAAGITVGEDSGSYLGEDVCVGFLSPGPSNEGDQDLEEWIVQASGGVAFDVGPTISDEGFLQFRPAAGAHGTAIVSVRAQDDGGTANGGVDLSLAQTFVIVVNDAPSAAADSFIALKDRTLNVGAPGVLVNDHDSNGDAIIAIKVTGPAHGVLTLAADGSFSYTPTPGYEGPDAFSYKASDGTLSSPTRIVKFAVTAIPVVATPTPIPTPTAVAETPLPTAQETPAATLPVETSEPEPTLEPVATPTQAVATLAPEPSATPAPAAGEVTKGGVPLPLLLVIVLFALLLAFGAALYVPKWLKGQRGEPPLE